MRGTRECDRLSGRPEIRTVAASDGLVLCWLCYERTCRWIGGVERRVVLSHISPKKVIQRNLESRQVTLPENGKCLSNHRRR